MTNPLPTAFEQAATAAEPIVCTVAAPRQSAMSGVYMGDELRTRSSRPGAYDALALPSLIGGQKRDPSAARAAQPQVPREALPVLSPLSVKPLKAPEPQRAGPQRAFPTVNREAPVYRPRPGGVPGKVIDHLRATRGFISHGEISALFGLTRNTITAVFKPAVQRGALVKHVVDGYVGFALPDWTPPAAEPRPAVPEPAESTSFAGVDDYDESELSALYELSLREAEQALLQRYVAALQLRKQFIDGALLFPLRPLNEPPRLTAAA